MTNQSLFELSQSAQKAWEHYVKKPTEENRNIFEMADDEYRIALDLQRRKRNATDKEFCK